MTGWRHLLVSNRVAAGQEQMLQSEEERKGPCHALVTDLGTVAERQAREAAAVIGYGHQAVVADLRQHRKRETLQVWEPEYLGRQWTFWHHILCLFWK